jgi:predicted AlkP superfamily pyrophosphatase or phosphodiesterase
MNDLSASSPLRALPRIAVLLLLAWLAGCASQPARVEASARPEPLILISLDGFRPDYLDWPEAAQLSALAASGARAEWMQPSYPSLTFPNHYTLVTGLHPDRHGVVNNTMRDAELGQFAMHLRQAVEDGRWWGGEPIWNTAQNQGLRAATMFWPGSEAAVQGQRPRDWMRYDKAFDARRRVAQVLAWLARPADSRPDFITLYFEQVDTVGHDHGPDSAEVRRAVAEVDARIGELLQGLEDGGWAGRVNLVIVSDHGMAALDDGQPILLDTLAPPNSFDLSSLGQVAGVRPRRGREAEVEAALLKPHAHMQCYRRGELPARWQHGQHPRVPPILCQAQPPHSISLKRLQDMPGRARKRGAHGYDPELSEMRALFLAAGPAFASGSTLSPVRSVDVYALLCRLLDIQPAPHQGNPRAFDAVLR